MDSMDDVCFVSVAFGDEYLRQQERLSESILKIYPDANMLFFHDILPEAARPFLDSLYGFKPHAVQAALNRGFKRIIWMDPAMILMDKVDDLFQFDIMAVKDDGKLCNQISPIAMEYFGMTKEEIEEEEWHLVGGSLYFFDFTKVKTLVVFRDWMNAEQDGIFGSQKQAASEQIPGHRYDETCLAMAMYLHGVKPTDADKVRYCIADNPAWTKKHFK